MERDTLKVCLKVNNKWLSKYIQIDDLSGNQIISKIQERFCLSSDNLYHFYYKKDQHHIISISVDDINLVLKSNLNRKYYLQPTQDTNNHWLANDTSQTKCDQNFVRNSIHQTKQHLIRQLAVFGKKFEEQIKQQIQNKVHSIEYKLLNQNDNKSINLGIYCQGSCQSNSFILGNRFKCLICPNFNLCQKCQREHSYQHNETHPFIKIRHQQQSPQLPNRKTLPKDSDKKAETKVSKKRVDLQKHFVEVTGASGEVYESLRKKYRLATVSELINFYYEQNV